MREKALSRLGRGRPNAQIRPVENGWNVGAKSRGQTAISQASLNRVSWCNVDFFPPTPSLWQEEEEEGTPVINTLSQLEFN